MKGDRPAVLLLARLGLLANEWEVRRAVREAGYSLAQVDGVESLAGVSARERSGPAVVLCHLLSTLRAPAEIEGYQRFLQRYARLKREYDLRLIVISPPLDEGPGAMVGYGALVDAYLVDPPDTSMLRDVLHRLHR